MTFSEAAVEVLRLVGRPMHFKKITQVAISKNLLSHVGKTPEVTMSARLAALVGKDRGDVPIVRLKPGIFGLREWAGAPPSGPEVGENDQLTLPGEVEETRGKAKPRPKLRTEPKEKEERRKKDGKERPQARRGRKTESGPEEPAVEARPTAAPEVTELEEAQPQGPRADDEPAELSERAALAADLENSEAAEYMEDEVEGEAEEEGPSRPHAGPVAGPPGGAHGHPSEVGPIGGEAGGRRRRRRRRRRGGERAETTAGSGPIVEIRGRNGGGALSGMAPRPFEKDYGGNGDTEPLEEAAAEQQPGVEEAELVGEVMAEREEERERIPRPPVAREAERREELSSGFRPAHRLREAQPPVGERRREEDHSVADGAYRLLVGQERTGGVPVRQLSDQAVKGGLLPPDSPAPWMVVGAALRADSHRRLLAGLRPRFRALSGGRWALFEWGVGGEALRLESETIQLGERQREAARKTLLRRVVDMGDPQFEHLVLLLLDRLGYERPRRIHRPNAGREVHLAATNRNGPGGVVTALVFVRSGREIDAARVSELRGGIHHYGAVQGWILSTGSLSSLAREEAAAPGAAPVGLTDGTGLARLFEETSVGLCKARVDLCYLDVELLDALKSG